MKTSELIYTIRSYSTEEPGEALVSKIRQQISQPIKTPITPSLPGTTSGGVAMGIKIFIGAGVIVTASSVWYLSQGGGTDVAEQYDKPLIQQEERIEQPVIAEEPSEISGYVYLPDGTALADARVWVETVLDPYPNYWHQRANNPKDAYKGRICRTDKNGYFAFTENEWPERFIVKAVPKEYPATITEIIENKDLPFTGITIMVDDSGGYIVGTLKDTEGAPVTNVVVTYNIRIPSVSRSREVSIPVKVEKDGSYISSLIPAGKYNLVFESPGRYYGEKSVFIRRGEADIVNVTLKQIISFAITGIVYDAEVEMPLKDVEVLAKEYAAGTQIFQRLWVTESSGFFISEKQHTRLFFRHPKYGLQSKSFNYKQYSSGLVNVTLSHEAPVCVRVYKHDGTPATGYKVKCPNDYTYYITDDDGECTIICKPDKPVSFIVFEQPSWRTISAGDTIIPEPGILNEASIYLPPTGSLKICMPKTIDSETINISCSPILVGNNTTKSYSQERFIIMTNVFTLNHISPETYEVIIKGNYISAFTTNVNVYTDETTHIFYKDSTNNNGYITGIVKDGNGMKVPGKITLWTHSTQKKISEDYVGDSGMTWQDCRPFLFSNLDPEMLYDISVEIVRTNIYIYEVVPNGLPLEIVVPKIYRVTGKIVTETREKIENHVEVHNSNYKSLGTQDGYENGEFFWYPLLPGTYYFTFRPNEVFSPQFRKITIIDSDVDIGDIIFDKGITVSGKIVDEQYKPINNSKVLVFAFPKEPDDWYRSHYCAGRKDRTDQDGAFEYNKLPKNQKMLFIARKSDKKHSIMKEIGPFSSDTDLGTVVMEKMQCLILTLKDSSGRPVSGLNMKNIISDENGIWKGIAPADPFLSFSKSGKYFSVPYWPTDAPTNHITVTVPDNFINEL